MTLIVGTFAFCCIGFALTAVIPNEDAAPPITKATVLPLYFLSGRLHPGERDPRRRPQLRHRLPDPPFLRPSSTAYDPATTGAGFEWGHLAIVAAWGIAGLVLAVRFFRWSPRGE